jgi:protein TonB
MEPLTILRADPLDLLFENRNKAYGAYQLRKYYAQRLMAFPWVFLISFLIILSFFYLRFRSMAIVKKICPLFRKSF